MQEKVIAYLQSYQKGRTLEQLKTQFSIQDAKQTVSFYKLLNDLISQHILYQDDQMKYYVIDQFPYIKGTIRMNEKGFGFVENSLHSIYINKHELKPYFPEDEVIVYVQQNADQSVEGKIVKLIHHNCKFVIGTIKKKEGFYFLPDKYFHHKKFHITNLNQYQLSNNTKVKLKIDQYAPNIYCSIVDIIGKKHDPGVDILSVLYENDIKVDFDEETLKESLSIATTISKQEKIGRRDFTKEMVITIDGDDAKDLDDAISIRKLDQDMYQLAVHIADVSHYVKEHHALDKEAYQRGTSVYVCDRVVPMLPPVLSNGICSLHPDVERLTISCIMDIDRKGDIQSYEIVPSIIQSKERMTYHNVNEIFNGNSRIKKQYSHILELCDHMQEVAKRLRKRRKQMGAIDFDVPESKVIVNKKGFPIAIQLRDRGEAERIIEDFMICANECVATHMRWMELPSIYRTHEEPKQEKLKDFAHIASMLGFPMKGSLQKVYPKQLQELLQSAQNDDAYPILSRMMLRSMQKAKYHEQCLGHFGLALENYLHFTSPIRRYPDLIVHRMLRKYFFTEQSDHTMYQNDLQTMQQIAKQSSTTERKAIDAERDVDDMKKAQYMEQFIGQEFYGIISSITKFGFFVELENTVEGLVHISTLNDIYHYHQPTHRLVAEHSSQCYTIGQKVKVLVHKVNRYERQIDFLCIERPKNTKKKKKDRRLL